MTAQHVYREGNQWGVTVAEIVARIAAEGLPVRLRWPEDDPDEPYRDDLPTGYLPRLP